MDNFPNSYANLHESAKQDEWIVRPGEAEWSETQRFSQWAELASPFGLATLSNRMQQSQSKKTPPDETLSV